MKITFVNVENEKIKYSFQKVLERYDSLHNYEILLWQKFIGSSTMQAQPLISPGSLITGIKRYKISLGIYVRDSKKIKVAELPEDVLTGWFAHELGHLVDYECYSNLQMIVYGLKYLLSKKFKRKVEHEADYIAIKNGFHDEIIATKKFILEHESLDNGYKDHIKNYYLSIEDVRMCMEDKKLP